MRPEMLEHAREALARAGLGELSGRALVTLAVACTVVLAATAWRFWPAGASTSGDVVSGAQGGVALRQNGTDDSAEASSAATHQVVVHVTGAVHRPGVYALPEGSRVSDAIAAAGGCLGSAVADAVNLARILLDGEQIRMPTAGEVAAGVAIAAGASAGSPAVNGGKIDLNRASAGDLEALPGIGPTTAQRIVDDRSANGPFRRIEDLMRVTGIGEKRFEALKDYVTVS